MPVVQAGAPYRLLVDIKTERLHQVQRRPRIDTKPADRTGIVGDLRMDKDDVKQGGDF